MREGCHAGNGVSIRAGLRFADYTKFAFHHSAPDLGTRAGDGKTAAPVPARVMPGSRSSRVCRCSPCSPQEGRMLPRGAVDPATGHTRGPIARCAVPRNPNPTCTARSLRGDAAARVHGRATPGGSDAAAGGDLCRMRRCLRDSKVAHLAIRVGERGGREVLGDKLLDSARLALGCFGLEEVPEHQSQQRGNHVGAGIPAREPWRRGSALRRSACTLTAGPRTPCRTCSSSAARCQRPGASR